MVYLTKAIETLRKRGENIPEATVAHIAPLGWEHIRLIGDYHFAPQSGRSPETLRPLPLREKEESARERSASIFIAFLSQYIYNYTVFQVSPYGHIAGKPYYLGESRKLTMSIPLEVFCCYAREDQEMLEHLKKHLMHLQRSGQITIWSDTNLNAGMGSRKKNCIIIWRAPT